jgi:hypothetical protein
MLILGVQVLIGLDYRSAFEAGFQRLGFEDQVLKLVSLSLLLLSTVLLCAPASYHNIVENGENTHRFHGFVTRIDEIVLLPIAAALGLDLYSAGMQIGGVFMGRVVGIVGGVLALLLWYGWEWAAREARSRRINVAEKKEPEEPTPASEKIKELLREDRMVLPGVQALLGFQFIVILMEGFQKLPAYLKYVHLASLCLIAISIILLIAPAAYHRIVEQGEASERFYRLASKLILAGLAPLALGMCGDLFVVMMQVTSSLTLSLVVSGVMLLVFYGIWFGYAFYKRAQGGTTASEKKVLQFTRSS